MIKLPKKLLLFSTLFYMAAPLQATNGQHKPTATSYSTYDVGNTKFTLHAIFTGLALASAFYIYMAYGKYFLKTKKTRPVKKQ